MDGERTRGLEGRWANEHGDYPWHDGPYAQPPCIPDGGTIFQLLCEPYHLEWARGIMAPHPHRPGCTCATCHSEEFDAWQQRRWDAGERV